MTAVYVGPARVLAAQDDGRPLVQVLGGDCETSIANWAIPFHYVPGPGDTLLVIGRDNQYWVTGVLSGRGRSQIAFHQDTTLQASGTLDLGGDGGVRLESPTIQIDGNEYETDTEQCVQHSETASSTVRGTLHERAGESARIIDENDEHVAGRHSTVAKHAVKIDGEMLRLS